MAKATIIGKVAVKVYPDTDNFHRDLKRQLDQEERRLEVRIPALLDADKLKDQLRVVIAELNHIAEDGIDVKVKINSDDARHDADRLREMLEEKLDEITGELKLHTDSFEIAEETRRRVLEQAENLNDDINDKLDDHQVNVTVDLGSASLKYAQSRLAVLTRPRRVKIIPELDNAALRVVATKLAALSGGRLIGQTVDDLNDLVKGLDKNLPKIALVAQGVAGIAGWALSASANLFALSRGLAQIAGAGLALPGILGGMAIGLTVTILALKDFKKVLPDVVDDWKKLQDVASKNFWLKFEGPMRRMSRTLLPQLSAGFGTAAREVGGFFGAFADGLSRRLNGLIKPMFADLAESIKIASGGTDAMAQSIAILGRQGAGQLPRLARFFTDLNVKFANFLEKSNNNGDLTEWINLGIQRLKELGTVAKQSGRILAGLARAAELAGGTTLDALGDSLQKVADKVNSPAFQHDLVGVLRAADTAMQNISNRSGPAFDRFWKSFAEDLQVILPMVGDTIGTFLDGVTSALSTDEFSRGLRGFFSGLKGAVEALRPAFEPLGEALGALLDLAGHMAQAFSPALAGVLTTISRAFQTLAPYLRSVVTNLSGPLAGLLGKLADPIQRIVSAVGPKLADIGSALGDFIKQITPKVGETADKLADFFVNAIKGLSKEDLESIFRSVGDIATSMLQIVDDVIKLADWAAGPDGKNVKSVMDGLARGTAETAKNLDSIVAGIGEINRLFETDGQGLDFWKLLTGKSGPGSGKVENIFRDYFSVDRNAMLSDLRKAGEVIASGLRWLNDLLTNILTGNNPVDRWINNMISSVGTSMATFASRAGSSIGTALRGLNDLIFNVLTGNNPVDRWINQMLASAGEALKNVGITIINGLIAGFNAAVGAVQAWLQQLTAWIPQWKGPADTDATLLTPAGEAIITSLIAGFEARVGAVRTWLQNLTSNIREWMQHPELLVQNGASILQGFVSGMASRIAAAQQAARNLLSAVRNTANQPSLLVSLAAAIGSGFANGVKSRVGAALAAAQSLANAARNGSRVSLHEFGVNAGAGFANGIRAMWNTVYNAAMSLAIAARDAIRSHLDINSPSKVAGQLGAFFGEGLAKGMLSQINLVERASAALSDAATSGDFTIKPLVSSTVASKSLSTQISAAMADDDKALQPTGGVNINVTNYNPVAEPTSVTTTRTLREAQSLGVMR